MRDVNEVLRPIIEQAQVHVNMPPDRNVTEVWVLANFIKNGRLQTAHTVAYGQGFVKDQPVTMSILEFTARYNLTMLLYKDIMSGNSLGAYKIKEEQPHCDSCGAHIHVDWIRDHFERFGNRKSAEVDDG